MSIEKINAQLASIPTPELVQKARTWISDLCESGGQKWSLRVPPDPERDPDLIFGELCRRLEPQPAPALQATQYENVDGYSPIYLCEMDKERFGLTREGAMLQDLAEAYAVCADEQANAGLIVYGKYNGMWRVNPWSTRFLVRDLLEQIGIKLPHLKPQPQQ